MLLRERATLEHEHHCLTCLDWQAHGPPSAIVPDLASVEGSKLCAVAEGRANACAVINACYRIKRHMPTRGEGWTEIEDEVSWRDAGPGSRHESSLLSVYPIQDWKCRQDNTAIRCA